MGSTKFPKDFIRAVNDWQAGSVGRAKKAARLKKASAHLPESFRTNPAVAYRQFRMNTRIALPMVINEAVAEGVSSWTSDLEVAKRFGEAHFDPKKLLLIYARNPAPSDTILNLDVVYADSDFLPAVVQSEEAGLDCSRGIRRYMNSQHEIVLDERDMRNDEVVFIGAFRGIADVVPLIGERAANAMSDDEIFRELTGKSSKELTWAPRTSAEVALRNYIDRARQLLGQLATTTVWEASDTKLRQSEPK